MSKLLLVDCDDVLLNWDSYLRKHLSTHAIHPATHVAEHRLYRDWIGLPDHEMLRHIDLCHAHPEFESIEPHLDVLTVLPSLIERGYEFVVVTGCGDAPHVTQARHRNLRNHFGSFYREIVFTGRGESKRDALARFPEAHAFIDDLPHNLEVAQEVGLRPIWFQNNAPQHLWSGETVSSWQELSKIL